MSVELQTHPAKTVQLRTSIIMPAYNEEGRISARLQSLVSYFDEALGKAYELLVVMDGCTDRTAQMVSQLAKDNCNIVAVSFPMRLGKGGALIEAFKIAKGDILLLTDADDSIRPQELLRLAKEMENCDFVVGSRYAKGSRLLVREPFLRFFLGRAFNTITKLLFWRMRGINDTQCGCKAIKKSVVEKIRNDLFITGFAIDVNLIYSAMRCGFKVKEVGVAWMHVEKGSKVSGALMKLVLGMFFSLVKLRLYYSRLRCTLSTRPMKALSSFLWNLTKA